MTRDPAEHALFQKRLRHRLGRNTLRGRILEMRENLDSRELAHSIGPVVVAVLALASTPTWEHRVSVPSPEQIYPLFALSALGVLLALYAPRGRHTLCLGTVVLPPAIWFFGVSWAGWLAAGIYLVREVLRRLLYDEPLYLAMNANWGGLFDEHSLMSKALARFAPLPAQDADDTTIVAVISAAIAEHRVGDTAVHRDASAADRAADRRLAQAVDLGNEPVVMVGDEHRGRPEPGAPVACRRRGIEREDVEPQPAGDVPQPDVGGAADPGAADEIQCDAALYLQRSG